MTRIARLYTTDHCQLCDAAFEWLLQCQVLQGVQLETIDVSGDDALMERFADQIPVLVLNGRSLVWPFTEAGIRKLMTPAPD